MFMFTVRTVRIGGESLVEPSQRSVKTIAKDTPEGRSDDGGRIGGPQKCLPYWESL